MSIASICISSLEPLQVGIAVSCQELNTGVVSRSGREDSWKRDGTGREGAGSHQYCALSPTWSLWYVRPWMVLYSRMLEVMESVELAVSPNAESLSSSRSCCT